MRTIASLLILAIAFGALFASSEGLAADAKKGKQDKGRQRVISGEARSKHNQKTKIDFEDTDIDGQRRTPAGIAITKKNPDQDYDLINLRLRWHPEMIQSASSLETGRGR